jgi:peptidyl-prolyl cis-trans isomerase SurA
MRNSFFYFGASALLLWGCKATEAPVAQEPVLATIGGKPVYASEFEYVYNKNNSDADNAYNRESVLEYLDLYTNFRLKVLDAESRGLDTTKAFQAELDGYKQQLAQPYLTEKSVTDQLVREAYARLQQEINASHILINVAADAEPKDTLAAYNRILELRQRALAGENFGKLATTYSEDPSARDNNGNLGYFTALQMVYPFEDAAYKTPPGALTPPVRTRCGYHLIKVNDARPAQGEIKVAHIMVRATPGMPKADSVMAKKKIDEIYSRVLRKENWDKLVAQFSEDASSSQNGGELPWFGTGRMIPSFEEAAFKLAKAGDISQPVLTPYGWHIIKFLERRTLPPYEDMEPTLRSRVAKDSRSELNKAAFLKRIKAENKFQEMAPAKSYVMAKADTTLLSGAWKNRFPGKETDLPLFTIQNRKFTIKDFFHYVEQHQRPRQQSSPAHAMTMLYDNFVNESLVNYEKENLENKYVDYRMLVREYRDGILLFQLMDEKVWSKAISDTVGLNSFFQSHRDNYRWDTRADATVLSAASPDILAQARQMLARGRFEVRKNKPAPVAFEAGKTTLNGRAKGQLEELATRLAADTTLSLAITGQSTAAESRTLAARRAAQVQQFFAAKGLPARRIVLNPAKTKARQRTALLQLHSSDIRVLEQNLNEKNPLALQAMRRRFVKGENKILDGVTWQPGTTTLQQDGRYYSIQIHQVLPPAYKQLNETRGVATSDYQAYLEKEWINQLRQRYPVEVNQQQVEKLIKK